MQVTHTKMLKSAKAVVWQAWNEQDIQVTVVISLIVQLFLLFAGILRRRKIFGFLRFIIWLAYVGADAIAVFAIGLLCKYEEKYKLRSQHSPGELTLPFLWAPFLLLHLGGQDTMTAFSIEDNNLWLRHLLNLVVQVTLTLYVFAKSFDILDSQLLAVAMPIFVAGIIKYGERTWALYTGSRDNLGNRREEQKQPRDYTSVAGASAYALNTVLRVRGLLMGRTLFQLGEKIENELVHDFAKHGQKQGKLKIVMMELGMMYDLLYTKAMVLQSLTGQIFRCIAEISMVVAFVLFLANRELHAHNRANVAITYTLFVGAMFMEAFSLFMVIVSPWTKALSKQDIFICWLSCSACSLYNAIVQPTNQQQQQQHGEQQQGVQQNQQLSISFSLGQFNLTDYALSKKRRPKLISKVVGAMSLEKKWRNTFHTQHVQDEEMSNYIEKLLCTGEGSQKLELGRELNYVLTLPFEHALFRLHIFTDLYLSSLGNPAADDCKGPAAECRKLSEYLMFLMAVYPSMLPVSSAAQDLEYVFAKWVSENHTMTKPEILNKYAAQVLGNETYSGSPFESASLGMIKEVWARLLIYAAGKCPVELHARQLGSGPELLTAVWLLMVHHGAGDVGKREVSLFQSSDPHVPTAGSLVPVADSNWIQRVQEPLHAFEFRQHEQQQPTQEQVPSLYVEPFSPLRPTRAAGNALLLAALRHLDPESFQALLQSIMNGQPVVGSASTETEQAAADRSSSETEQPLQEVTSQPEDTSPETDVAASKKQDHVVVVEMQQAVDAGIEAAAADDDGAAAALETERAQSRFVALQIEHDDKPGTST